MHPPDSGLSDSIGSERPIDRSAGAMTWRPATYVCSDRSRRSSNASQPESMS